MKLEKNSTLLGIVTARGGSKGVPHKNLYPVAGKPLIAYCIRAAQSSGIFDRIIISTDSQRIADVARALNVDVPFMRPKELAEDSTPHFPVVRHALDALPEKYPYAAIIAPTAPLVQGRHWREAWDLLRSREGSAVIGVGEVPFKYHPAKSMVEGPRGFLRIPEERRKGTPRQATPKGYYSTAGVYIFKTANVAGGDFYGDKVIPYEMEEEYALDINERKDIVEARRRIAAPYDPSIEEEDELAYQTLCLSFTGEKSAS